MTTRMRDTPPDIDEHVDDRDADELEYERTGHVVVELPAANGPECEGHGWYE